MRALVIGGTGPTGHHIVNGLLARGYSVDMLHSGRHEVPEIPDEVRHIHTDAFDETALRAALETEQFDVCIATYGRLRVTAAVMVGRCEQFISVGGGPAYLGYMNAGTWTPEGMPVPTREDAPTVQHEADDAKGYRIRRTEETVMALHPTATHFRYPYIYGRYQALPREWPVVRRVLDGRRRIVVGDGGLTLCHFGAAQNMAHAVLLAVDNPAAAAGRIFNCGDDEVLSVRQVIEIVADACGHEFEIVSMPWELAVPARPMVMNASATHRVFDTSSIRAELGYRDVVPARQALITAAQDLLAAPLERGGREEFAMTDPFDYEAEDALIDSWKRALSSMSPVTWVNEPRFTLSYSGPGGQPRRSAFE